MATTKRDYYEVLGVARDASSERDQVRLPQARRSSTTPTATPATARPRSASRRRPRPTPSSPTPRSARATTASATQGVGGGGGGGFDPTIFADFGDILGDLFGFGGGRRPAPRRPRRGADLRYDLELSFEEAAFGTETTLPHPAPRDLRRPARGSGARRGTAPATCRACGGAGQVRFSQGFFTVARTCPQCAARGGSIADPCKTLPRGRPVEKQRIQIKIPAGVDTGASSASRARASTAATAARRATSTSSSRSSRTPASAARATTVHGTASLSFPQAVLGASIEVETIHGPSTLDVPGGTQHGKQLPPPRPGRPAARRRRARRPRRDGRGRGPRTAPT